MAITTIRSTYALDVETVRALDAMAKRWQVSKSEALRRAIRSVAARPRSGGRAALRALNELQRSLALSEAQARQWTREVRRERRAASAGRQRAR